MKRIGSILLMAAVLSSTALSGVGLASAAPTEEDLKAQFKQRRAALAELRNAGKVGETSAGLVGVVERSYASQSVNVAGEGATTVGELVGAENRDRKQLYALIGERTGEPAREVAKQAAIRNFKKAKPEHFLQLQDGRWVKKKDLPKGG
jgi:uncharacterized protein YdbL (DUF1318 family)